MYRLAAGLAVILALSTGRSVAVSAAQAALTGREFDARSGKPVAGATVTLGGFPGTAKTDADGRFTWEAAPAPPFQVIVVLPGGQVARPVDIKAFDGGIVTVPVDALADESVTVLGSAPSIAAAPAAGSSLLSSAQISRRTAVYLLQDRETVPCVN